MQLDRHTVYSIITNFMSTREEGEGADARATLGLLRLGKLLAFTFSKGSVALPGKLGKRLWGWGSSVDLMPCCEV